MQQKNGGKQWWRFWTFCSVGPWKSQILSFLKASLKPLQLQSFGPLKFDLQNYSFLKVFMKQTSRHLDSEAQVGLSVEKRAWIQISSDKKNMLFSINTPVCKRVENTLALKFTLKNKMNIPILFTAEIVSVVTLFTCCYHSLTFHHWRHSVHPLLIFCIDDLQYPGWKLFFLILMRSLPCYNSSKFQLSSVDALRELVQQQLKEQTDHREPNKFWFENKTKNLGFAIN